MPRPVLRMIDRITGRQERRIKGQLRRSEQLRAKMAVQAGSKSAGGGNWNGTPSNRNEDAGNKEYATALGDVLQRCQDLDVNNPDLRGFHRARTAQVLGAHVRFKSTPKHEEVELEVEPLKQITTQIDRLRHLHSRTGEIDATGRNRSEGELQQCAMLTSFVHGSCLVHRVWRSDNRIVPLSLELIPGVRISTPIDRHGDPKISYGIEYSDNLRTRVVAYHVRRVSQTLGDSFVPSYQWDRLPAEDCSLLSLTEVAGMDRAMPLAVANVKMIRNRGEFIEASVAAARAQSKLYAATECAQGTDPFAAAADDAEFTDESDVRPMGFTQMGDDVFMLYTAAGEKVVFQSAKLPGPDFADFMAETDKRLARGLSSSLSRFTREVNSSWAGGRLEDQQDDPIIDQYRRTFCSAWQKVNEWFLQALWLSGVIELPGYSAQTAVYWSEFRAQFPGKLHINQVDTMTAREKGFLTRTKTPQQACEEDGYTLDDNLELWAEAVKAAREKEKKHGLKEGTLDFMVSGLSVSTVGDDAEEDGAKPGQKSKPKLKIAGGA